MADSELQNLTADTAPASGDIVYVVVDPAGTPLARQMTVDNLLKAINIVTADATPGMDSVIVAIDDPAGTPAAKKTSLGQAYTRYVCLVVTPVGTALTIGNGKTGIHIPTELNGYNLTYIHGESLTASAAGGLNFQAHNLTDAADMLSTALTIDQDDTGSDTAAAPAVINTATDDVATNDFIQIDVDDDGDSPTGGVFITLGFRAP